MDNFQNVFREYDIRGKVKKGELDEDNVRRIAEGFAFYLKKRDINSVVVGYDNRKISPIFAEIAVEVFLTRGFTIYDIGLCITPAAYFAQYYFNVPGLMMVTASHNPADWCGFKLGDGFSKTLNTAEIHELYGYCQNQIICNGCDCRKGEVITKDIREPYISDIVKRYKAPKNDLRIVVDAGNGAAGIYIWELFQRLGYLTFQLNCDLDNNYPHYFPNPSEKTAREALKRAVMTSGINADIGLGFDGDGDRLGVIDALGHDVWADRILMVLAEDYLRKFPAASVVFDVKCTNALSETIKKLGGRPIMWKTGHSHIKEKMKVEGAILAGERSGHIFIGDNGRGYDDALAAAAALLKIMAQKKLPLFEILRSFPQYATSSEIRIFDRENTKYRNIENLKQYFIKNYGQDKVCAVNGARVDFPQFGGWALVRASSNLPELVMVLEAKDGENLLKLESFFKKELVKNGIGGEWQNV